MLQSHLYIPTRAHAPADEQSLNGQLLQQSGFVDKLQAGVYSWLPLGLRVLNRIANIIREELQAIGADEVLMPALQPKKLWAETGRWQTLQEIMYQWQDGSKHDVGLASTHEEVIVDIARRGELTYRTFAHEGPAAQTLALYQTQWKFRNEPRAKSGVIRGREFLMKDLYSFHPTAAALEAYYEVVHHAYQAVYKRVGVEAHRTEASGGTFTKKHSHEYQVFSEAGEDKVLHCVACGYVQNLELGTPQSCPQCGKPTTVRKSIEVGNTFNFGDSYGTSMKLQYTDQAGKRQPLFVASYGIGVSRLVGTIVEVYGSAENGMAWPVSVAPFHAHVLLVGKADDALKQRAMAFEKALPEKVLFDDRDVSPGFKLKDADLIGLPYRIIFSSRNGDKVEVTNRATGKTKHLTAAAAQAMLQAL